jgi:hypothetical protein
VAHPTIVEHYPSWQPPQRVRRTVEAILNSIPDAYLVGLRDVVLTTASALPRPSRRRKVRGRGRRAVLGSYFAGHRGRSPRIELYLDHICSRLPSPHVLRIPLLCDIFVGKVLLHEIGHHIDAVRHARRAPERTAEAWVKTLARPYFRAHYGYLRLPVRILRPVLGKLRGLLQSRRRSASRRVA